jgi:hypothetical protein
VGGLEGFGHLLEEVDALRTPVVVGELDIAADVGLGTRPVKTPTPGGGGQAHQARGSLHHPSAVDLTQHCGTHLRTPPRRSFNVCCRVASCWTPSLPICRTSPDRRTRRKASPRPPACAQAGVRICERNPGLRRSFLGAATL